MHTPSRNLLFPALAALLAASMSACVLPYHYTDAPGVAGQVVSGITSRPVAGATVSMTADSTSVQTRTDQNGSFRLPALQHWGTFSYPSDGIIDGVGTLRVEAAGFEPYADSNVGSTTSHLFHQGLTAAQLRQIHVTLVPGA